MAGIANALRYLNSAELVVSIQRFFGVEQITVEQINGRHSPADSQTEKFTNGDAGGCSPHQRHYSLRSASQSKKFDNHETNIANGDVRHRGKEETDIDNNTISVSKTVNGNLSHTNGYAVGVSVPKSEKHKNFSGILHDVVNTIHSKVGPKAVTDNELTEKHVKHDSKTPIKYKINNVFYYLLFSFGAGLGNDFFYITYFPFCLWNLDSYITRRVCLGWYMLMYLGQASKDIIRWPRPKSPPTVRLELRYELEYGMPSTHAIVGSALPFTFLFLAHERFEFNFAGGLVVAIGWSLLVGLSRVYLGMHTPLDILVGYLYVGVFLPIIFPFFDVLDYLHVMHPYCIFLFVTINILLCIFYPTLNKWSTARGDTTVIFAITTGIFVASWLNFQQGFLVRGSHDEGRIVLELPTVHWLFIAVLRLVVGVLFLECVRWTMKKVCRRVLCFLHNVSHEDALAARLLSIELPYYFIIYSTVGFSAVYVSPLLFTYMGIMRDAYYTEI